ncbi:hypothetical protein SO802_033932 [Lithocarpus litseifolius]|uniref:Uncharacterized protein n=1 Tax=Lithocarpus litseifolius TaxID=425828 RepID=A0AAW2BGM6_9ROSI
MGIGSMTRKKNGYWRRAVYRRIAVVTEANKAIGYEICKQLAAYRVRIVLTASDVRRGNEAVEHLRATGYWMR